MDYIKGIRTELDSDPARYDSMGSQKVADELNKPIATIGSHRLTTLGILDLLGSQDGASFLIAIENIATTNDAVRLATRSIDSIGVDVGNPTTRAMIDVLVDAGALDSVSAGIVKGVANATTTRAAQLNLPEVRPGFVEQARAL